MAWIESHTVLSRHRKLLPLSRALRFNTAQTIGHLHLLWHAALEQQENGDLSQWSDELIAELAGYTGDAPQFVRLLQEFGWLDGKMIHDWWDYAGHYLQGKYGRSPEKWQSIKCLYSNSKPTASKQQTIPTRPTIPDLPYLTDMCFERLWKEYPKKIGKGKAFAKAQKQILNQTDFDNCLKAINNYKVFIKGKDFDYVKHGSTFFNEDWKDFINYEEHADVKKNGQTVNGRSVKGNFRRGDNTAGTVDTSKYDKIGIKD